MRRLTLATGYKGYKYVVKDENNCSGTIVFNFTLVLEYHATGILRRKSHMLPFLCIVCKMKPS